MQREQRFFFFYLVKERGPLLWKAVKNMRQENLILNEDDIGLLLLIKSVIKARYLGWAKPVNGWACLGSSVQAGAWAWNLRPK